MERPKKTFLGNWKKNPTNWKKKLPLSSMNTSTTEDEEEIETEMPTLKHERSLYLYINWFGPVIYGNQNILKQNHRGDINTECCLNLSLTNHSYI